MCTANASQTGYNLVPNAICPSLSMRFNRSKQDQTSSTRSGHLDGRRCSSAHVRSSRSDRLHPPKSRSHSQEPRSSHLVPIPTNGPSDRPSTSSVERTDLTRMYDYATWNMYERIVNARRLRLAHLDAQRKLGDSTESTEPTVDKGRSTDQLTLKNPSELHKAHSREDSSTSSTVDDAISDKSSNHSCASSTPSDSAGVNKSRSVFSLPIKAIHSEQDVNVNDENEEQFIFEMDM